MDMTDTEIDVLARRCLRSLAAAGAANDPALLSEGGFSPAMRRALERFIAQTPYEDRLRPDTVERVSYRLAGRKLFPDMRAYLHHVDTPDRKMVQLTAAACDGAICDFAYLEDVTRLSLPYLKEGPGLGRDPWHNVAMFSMNYKISALIPRCGAVSFSTRRLGETMEAMIKTSRERFQALSASGASALMDDLISIVKNALRLMFGDIRPSAAHIVLIGSLDEPRTSHLHGIGQVPKELQLAERLVEVG